MVLRYQKDPMEMDIIITPPNGAGQQAPIYNSGPSCIQYLLLQVAPYIFRFMKDDESKMEMCCPCGNLEVSVQAMPCSSRGNKLKQCVSILVSVDAIRKCV